VLGLAVEAISFTDAIDFLCFERRLRPIGRGIIYRYPINNECIAWLQVIKCRFGTRPHVSMMIFAVTINLFIMGMVLAQGGKAFTVLIPGN